MICCYAAQDSCQKTLSSVQGLGMHSFLGWDNSFLGDVPCQGYLYNLSAALLTVQELKSL